MNSEKNELINNSAEIPNNDSDDADRNSSK